jgi:casein kinase II subunit alpha
MEWCKNMDFRTLYEQPDFNLEAIKSYIYNILKGADYAHQRGIIHRDLKPGNVLFLPEKRTVKIVDWGLADFYEPGKRFNVRVASRYFKGPELLLNFHFYNYTLDVWSAGCMLAGMMFKKEPFFKGTDNDDQMIKIAKVIGTEEVKQYLEKFKDQTKMTKEIRDNLLNFKKKPWSKFVTKENERLVCQTDGFDLLTKMLTIDHSTRITAKDALDHPFFDSVR